ncbi:hypothetical protein ACSLBF_14520 [Pseudoalteromonas sp. T1lg65]|uniref:hypothetical protein n=1 Tax=Pseudoalteromonas sp. T1lg65 TaxID=2077101 RepID=UPI003F7AC1ED
MKKTLLLISILSSLTSIYLFLRISEIKNENSNLFNQLESLRKKLELNSGPILETKLEKSIECNVPTQGVSKILSTNMSTNAFNKPNENSRYNDESYINEAVKNQASIDNKLNDEQWAFEFSDKVYNYFSTHPELVNFHIQNINCDSTKCDIDLFIYDNEPIETAQAIGKALQEKEWKEHPFYLGSVKEDGSITIEINRNKEQ